MLMLTDRSKSYGDETVILRVGIKRIPFKVSKSLLVAKSKYFERCFNGHFAEASQKEFVLKNTYSGIFRVVLNWMDTGRLSYGDGESSMSLQNELHDEAIERDVKDGLWHAFEESDAPGLTLSLIHI